MNIKDNKSLLFLINFFEGIGIFNYPFFIFKNTQFQKTEILKKWKKHDSQGGDTQLYVHTLFCETKCHFCNCVSYVENDESYVEKYKKHLKSEIELYAGIVKKPLESLYFGGGTVSLWSEEDLDEIFSFVREKFKIAEGAVWFVELHPESTNRKKLEILKKNGVTNLMLGLQSLNKELSLKNNRPYSGDKIQENIDTILELGFKNLYFDLMYALPYETEKHVKENMESLLAIARKLQGKINLNVEINKWNVSYTVPFYKLKVQRENKSFTDFAHKFLAEVKSKTKIVNTYVEKYFSDIFQDNRPEVDSRNKKNIGVLGLGYGAISYIPGEIIYTQPVEYKHMRDFYDTQGVFEGLKLDKDYDRYHFLLNNFRREIPVDTFLSFLSEKPEAVSIYKTYQDKFILSGNNMTLHTKTDIETHLLSLTLYDEKQKRAIYKKLLTEWIALGNSPLELRDNIDLYLDIIYVRPDFY